MQNDTFGKKWLHPACEAQPVTVKPECHREFLSGSRLRKLTDVGSFQQSDLGVGSLKQNIPS